MRNRRIATTMLFISVLALASCQKQETATFTIEKERNNVEFHTEDQLTYFINNMEEVLEDERMLGYLSFMTDTKKDYTIPQGIELSWTVETTNGLELKEFTVEVSESETFEDKYVLHTDTNSVIFQNAKISTTYYWRVSSGSFVSEVGSFSTNGTLFRTLVVDGVKNVRDIGGYGHIKQGLLYRGGAFESYDSKTETVTTDITEAGMDVIKNQLKIKTEVDLRKNDDSHENCDLTSSSVEGINYVNLPMYYGGKNILIYKSDDFDDPARIKDFFELLANEENYPVYFHCVHGKDRTGGLAYIVEALLGVEETYLYGDYLFSSLAAFNYRLKPSGINGNFGKTLHNYLQDEEMDYSVRVYKYLNEVVEIPANVLDSVINILSVK